MDRNNCSEGYVQKIEDEEVINFGKNMKHIYNYLDFISPSDEKILILGENGTGKEHIAKYIHKNSNRKDKKFISVNCGAIPSTLIDSALFGHKKGSFTGADKDTLGFFQEADKGTIFLDEIGDMAYETQARLLRIIQSNEVQPVGATKPEKVDTRIICATNKDILKLIEKNYFKQDLYYRINTFKIILPPLRDRTKSDILEISKYQLNLLNDDKYWKNIISEPIELTENAIQIIYKYSWPGNIRQLRDAIKHAFTLVAYEKKNKITESEIKEALKDEQDYGKFFNHKNEKTSSEEISSILDIPNFNLGKHLQDIEKQLITEALNKKQNQKLAGNMIGYSQQRIQYKIKKYNIKPNFN